MIGIERYYCIGKNGKQTFIVDMHTKHIINKLNQYYQRGQMHHFLVKPLQAELKNRNVKTELFMETKKVSTEQISDMLSTPLREELDLNLAEIKKARETEETLEKRNLEIFRKLSSLKEFQKEFSDKVLTFEQSKIVEAQQKLELNLVPPPPPLPVAYDYWERYQKLSKEIIATKQLSNKVKWAFENNDISNMAQALMMTENELMHMRSYGKKAHANFVDYCSRKGYVVEELVPYKKQISNIIFEEYLIESRELN